MSQATDQERWDGYGRKAKAEIESDPSKYLITGWRSPHAVALKKVLEDLQSPGSRVLDIGCGRGEMTVWLARRGAKASGVDLGPGLVDAARAVAALNQVDCEFRVGDITALPHEEGAFDFVVGKAILHHLSEDDVQKAAREAHRVLAPGGRFVVFEPVEDSKAFDLLQNVIPRHHPGHKHYRPSILQREAWRQWVAGQDDRAMTSAEFGRIGRLFSRSLFVYSGLTVRFAALVGKPWLAPRLLQADDWLLERAPCLRRYARNIVAVYEK